MILGMIERDLTNRLRNAAGSFPVVTLTGPRQSGKSTLCRAIFAEHAYVNLEEPDTRSFAADDPRAFLAQFPDGAIIDEVQRCPDLLSYLQVVVDSDPRPGKWILTGSQNLLLQSSVSQSLAGRTAVLHLLPLTYSEVQRFEGHPISLDAALLAGGYPRIFDQRIPPSEWLGSYVATYIERDVRTLANIGDLATFQRFLGLCAGRTSQLFNVSALATDCGISQPTSKAWLSVLETSFLTFMLPPWSGNIRKRLVKRPKLHFYDSGVVCWLLGIRTVEQLRTHPLRGAIFESWVVSEIMKHRMNRGDASGLYFFRDRHGLESDVLIDDAGEFTIVEAKSGQTLASDMFASVHRVREALGEDASVSAVIAYGGAQSQKRTDITVLPWSGLQTWKW